MGDKQRRFVEMYPNVHETVRRYFPDFDYNAPSGDRNVLCDMRNPGNMVGHQQRAVTTYWAIETCGPLDLGLDIGSPKGMTPLCVHVDLWGSGESHPFYGGGAYLSDLIAAGEDVDSLVPKNSLPFIASNHSLEHMGSPEGGDGAIVDLLGRWTALLRPGGVLAMVIPDNDHNDVLKMDRDHKHAWGAKDFQPRILAPLLEKVSCEVIGFDTLNNHFSFDVILRKR